MDLVTRFWSKVDQTRDCWIWLKGKKGKGYGSFYVGRINGVKHQEYAHRVSWELANGPIPDKIDVLHRCDNPPCVRPDHLFLGTQLENNRDCIKKGRAIAGRANRKLTPEQVREIRENYSLTTHPIKNAHRGQPNPNSQMSLAKKYHVTRELIRETVKGRNWKWLT